MIRAKPMDRRSMVLACLSAGACAVAGPESHVATADPQEYRLGPGDQIHIAIYGEPELTGDFTVNAHGSIGYPLIGDIDVQGKTVHDVTTNLTELLRQGYVRQPNVTVDMLNYRPFFILGEVGKPGSYPFASNLTVMNAVAIAGGFTYRADQGRVDIKHVGDDVERTVRLTSATQVMPGDTIRVRERRF